MGVGRMKMGGKKAKVEDIDDDKKVPMIKIEEGDKSVIYVNMNKWSRIESLSEDGIRLIVDSYGLNIRVCATCRDAKERLTDLFYNYEESEIGNYVISIKDTAQDDLVKVKNISIIEFVGSRVAIIEGEYRADYNAGCNKQAIEDNMLRYFDVKAVIKTNSVFIAR